MNRTVTARTSAALAVAGIALLAGCTSSGGDSSQSESAITVDVHLTGAGCNPAQLALPSAPVTLQVTNNAGSGEFDVQNAAGDSVAKLASIDQGQTSKLKLKLKTGYYTVECRTDDTTTMLTVGTPSGPPVDLGSVAAPDKPAPAGYGTADGNNYDSTNLVASSAAYNPQIVDPTMVDAWGLANRPAGAGGHFWIAANKTGTSMEYVGDVGGQPLNQQDLRIVSVPGATDTDKGAPKTASNLGQPTGTIFNPTMNFVVDQGAIKAPAKFLFAGQDGTISAWTEQDNPNGSVTQLAWATKVVDNSAAQSMYFGLAITPDGKRLLAADFGPKPGIKTFDSSFHPIATTGFANPFLKGGAIKPNDLIPWNVTTLGDKVYVSYAAVGADENNATKPSTGEENHADGAGRVVEYDNTGKMIEILGDKGSLDAPWGVATAPKGFGKLTGDLLVANFGDGTISAFNTAGNFVDYVRGSSGKPLVNAGIWALLPGNGASLGAANAIYFTAGPNAEQDGVFGRINAAD